MNYVSELISRGKPSLAEITFCCTQSVSKLSKFVSITTYCSRFRQSVHPDVACFNTKRRHQIPVTMRYRLKYHPVLRWLLDSTDASCMNWKDLSFVPPNQKTVVILFLEHSDLASSKSSNLSRDHPGSVNISSVLISAYTELISIHASICAQDVLAALTFENFSLSAFRTRFAKQILIFF